LGGGSRDLDRVEVGAVDGGHGRRAPGVAQAQGRELAGDPHEDAVQAARCPGASIEHVVVDGLQRAVTSSSRASVRAGRLDDVPAAVGRVAPADHEALVVEVVEQADEVGGVDPQPVAERTLRCRAVVAQIAEGDEMAHAEAQGRERTLEARLDRAREALDQQNRVRGGESRGLDVDACDHGGKCSALSMIRY
jgi:hypothetical protein